MPQPIRRVALRTHPYPSVHTTAFFFFRFFSCICGKTAIRYLMQIFRSEKTRETVKNGKVLRFRRRDLDGGRIGQWSHVCLQRWNRKQHHRQFRRLDACQRHRKQHHRQFQRLDGGPQRWHRKQHHRQFPRLCTCLRRRCRKRHHRQFRRLGDYCLRRHRKQHHHQL